MSARPKFATRKIRLVGALQVMTAQAMLTHLPIDPDHPIELIAREEVKTRKLDQNAAMWAGPLKDIAEQAWVNRRQYSIEVWHELFKAEYLPETDDPDLAELVKDPDTWRKWDHTPKGDRVLVGSTTQLTVKGFARYLQQVCAYGAQLGVEFHMSPNDRGVV